MGNATASTSIGVGDIVCWDSGYSMFIPHFARVTRRTPCTIVVAELETASVCDDGYGMCGTAVPTSVGTGMTMRCRARRDGSMFLTPGGRHAIRKWDGAPLPFDYMD